MTAQLFRGHYTSLTTSDMALPYVGQAALLADAFGKALDDYQPRSVAVLGCAGGNGFEQALTRSIDRIVGVDINPNYIERAHSRWQGKLRAVELYAGDVQTDEFSFALVDLVFAGLLFEYVDTDKVLVKIRSMLRADGVLVSVTQLPNKEIAEITPSPFAKSLSVLSSTMHLVPSALLRDLAVNRGYRELEEYEVVGASEKRFRVQRFRS